MSMASDVPSAAPGQIVHAAESLSRSSSCTSLCLSVASNLFDDDDEDEDQRILEADLRTREPLTYTREWDVMKEIPVHNCKPRRLKETESKWLPHLWDETGISSRGSGIELVDYRDKTLTTEEFENRFVACNDGIGMPCMIENVPTTNSWAVLSKWKDGSSFLEHYGDIPLHITEMFSVSNMGKEHGIRIPASHGRQALLGDFTPPRFFRDADDLYASTEETWQFFPWECHHSLLLGGKRTGSNLHKDPKGSGAWNTLLAGAKLWVFFPQHLSPEQLAAPPAGYKKESAVVWWLEEYPRLAAQAAALGMRRRECVQRPGETLWTPPNWYHMILNLEDFTLATTQNVLSRRMLSEQCQVSYPEAMMSMSRLGP